ncbi:hypothetical protein M9H77_23532 [Catharanthus roseus]|uniref:Uncharacterized protein n=1 Tax=Catharanthus roseus TaxID=4058 RepID=A0ACC0ATI8_CATRO|nr:hypothetical protein M9H77_23532 [Catharanthus roseus]
MERGGGGPPKKIQHDRRVRSAAKVDQRKVACFSPGLKAAYVVVGLPTRMPSWSKSPLLVKAQEAKKLVRRTFSSLHSPLQIQKPRERPHPFPSLGQCPLSSLRERERKSEEKTRSLFARSESGEHIAFSGHNWQETLGLVGASEHNELKPKMDQGSLLANPIGKGIKDGMCKVDRAPVL